MRALVDTSVWSLSLRKERPAEHPTVAKLTSMLQTDEDVFLIGLILQEILQAFRSDSSFRRVARHLEPFPLLELERGDFIEAATLHRKCAARGLSVSTADCQIAQAAIRHACQLLTADKDFERIAHYSELKLA